MAGERRRRLAAILAADVVGYSRLVGADEEGTLARLRALFRGVVQPTVAAHRGRVFKLLGDAFLAEFPSAVEAVRCAAALQDKVEARGVGEPDDRRVRLRVAVHLGDVVVEGGDLLGDGVNVAARLEGLAEPGGVVVSAKVADEVRGRVPGLALEDLGERNLKNVDRPVRAFRLRTPDGAPAAPGPAERPALALPDRPSLVVLPFQNMSGDAEQDYFADGLVEDITAALSRLRWLSVIARNSAFTYKGRAVDVRQVGRELGVRYVLEGSVRRAGARLRITGQLVDTEAGAHLWAERFDGGLDEVFELQDRITDAVAGAIEPNLRAAEIARAGRKPTASLDAYDLYLRALPLFHVPTDAGTAEALRLLRRALAADPGYARAAALASMIHASRYGSWWGDDDAEVAEALRLAPLALAAGRDDPEVLRLAGYTLSYVGREHDLAPALLDRALLLGGEGSAPVLSTSGRVRSYAGDWRTAIAHLERAARLSPLDPETHYFLSGISTAYFVGGRYEEAADYARRSARLAPRWAVAQRQLVASLAHMGRLEEARAACTVLLGLLGPRYSIASNRKRLPFRDPEVTERFIRGFRLAGVPE